MEKSYGFVSAPKRRWSLAVIALGAILVLSACGTSSDDAESGASNSGAGSYPDLRGTLTIGAILPVTGGSAPAAEDLQRGIELATEAVNRDGGVLGRRLEVAVEDSESAQVASVQAARKLVNVDRVPVVVGEYVSANSIAIHKYAQREGVVAINPTGSSPDLAEIGDFSFTTIASDAIAGAFAANTLHDAGYRSIGIITPNTPSGSGVTDAVTSTFEERGGTVSESILYQEGKPSYRSELERIQDSGPDAYVIASYVPDSITLMENAFEIGIEASQLYGVYLSLVVQDVDLQATAGAQGQDFEYVGPDGADYEQAYADKYGEDVQTPYSTLYYDSVMMAARAIERANSTDPSKIRDALRRLGRDYAGASGPISFDKQNQREEQPYQLLQVDDEGELVPLDSIDGPSE